MAKVTVKKNESIAKALRRFKRQCKKEGLIKEMRKRRCYIKPSERRRRSLLKTQRKNSRGN